MLLSWLRTWFEFQKHLHCAFGVIFWNRRRKIYMNVVTGGESWIYYFEPHQKISIWVRLTKNARRPCIATRITRIASTKKVMYAIFSLLRDLQSSFLYRKTSQRIQVFTRKEFEESLSKSTNNVDWRRVSVVNLFICHMTMLKSQGQMCDINFEKTWWLFSRTTTLFS